MSQEGLPAFHAPTTTVRFLTALTPREKQILACLETGATNAEIGARLFISPDCVKYHLKSIFAKLGARRRMHAVRLARHYQLLGPAELAMPLVRIVA
ncbi:MAG TPA: helix-turn-helix transcriptional regulator [Nevskiaceae bacterium]|nr:helix-turn-helix transcriptional regulator [Nevskiaceae bacterium]